MSSDLFLPIVFITTLVLIGIAAICHSYKKTVPMCIIALFLLVLGLLLILEPFLTQPPMRSVEQAPSLTWDGALAFLIQIVTAAIAIIGALVVFLLAEGRHKKKSSSAW